MGCIVSKRQDPVVPVLRRRLSLGEIGDGDEVDDVEVTQEDRHLLLELSQQQVLDFIGPGGQGRKYSIGSQTDKLLEGANSFSSKQTKQEGNGFNTAEECIGYACKKGLKPEAPNQDSFLIMRIEGKYALYGVFDGHGRKGHDVSNFVKDNMPKILFSQKDFEDDPQNALTQTFAKTQYLIEKATALKTIDATRSGTTCSIVLHALEQDVVYVAHVGDSRVVLGQKAKQSDGSFAWEAVDLTLDHKPDLPEERQRIEAGGGMVVFDGGWNYRVFAKGKKDSRGKRYPGLNMSRAMGDLTGFHDAGISASPDVVKQFLVAPTEPAPEDEQKAAGKINPLKAEANTGGSPTAAPPAITAHQIQPDTEKFLLLCSDGVWEFVPSADAVNEVAKFAKTEAMPAAEHLASLSWEHWMGEMGGQVVDDITVVIVHLGQ